MSTATLDTTDLALQHQQWHDERERALATEHGWLTLVALHWLPARPTALAGLPGRWWVDADGAARVSATPEDRLERDGVPLDLQASVQVEEGKSSSELAFTAHDGTLVVVEVIRRTGRTALRVRDPRAVALAGFTGVPIGSYDPSWVLDVPVRWYDEPRPVTVGAAQPGLVHQVSAVGEVTLERDGRSVTAVLTAAHDQVALLFSDDSPDVAPWRIVVVPGSPGDATVRIDLNRAVNLPYAFSDHGTCPAPVPGNHLPFAVPAGERRPERAS